MKETVKLVAVLTIICLSAGALLAVVNGVTMAPIREAEKAEKTAAISRVLPRHDNRPDETVRRVVEQGIAWTFYVAASGGAYSGAAVESVSEKGYGGAISVMVGFNAGGEVQAVEILKQKETPGLGAKITEPFFKKVFSGKSIGGARWAVKKDGGDIDQITAATISSRAVVEAVGLACEVYTRHKQEISQTPEKLQAPDTENMK